MTVRFILYMNKNRQVLILAVMTLAATLGIVYAPVSLHNAAAQIPPIITMKNNQTTAPKIFPFQQQEQRQQLPQVNGSINLNDMIKTILKDKVKISFTSAANTAQNQVSGGNIVSGHLKAIQGYLVYTFEVANYNTDTSRIVMVDAGNGKVLYSSNDQPFYYDDLEEGYSSHRCHDW